MRRLGSRKTKIYEPHNEGTSLRSYEPYACTPRAMRLRKVAEVRLICILARRVINVDKATAHSVLKASPPSLRRHEAGMEDSSAPNSAWM
jgi:hypothetical protein